MLLLSYGHAFKRHIYKFRYCTYTGHLKIERHLSVTPLDCNSHPLPCLVFELCEKNPAGEERISVDEKIIHTPTGNTQRQTVRAPIERHYACWQCDRLAQRDPQTSRPHNETGQEHWGLLRKRGLVGGGGGRSHWNLSVLVKPTEDVLDPAVTKCMWRMAAAYRGWHAQLNCLISCRRNELSQGRYRQHSQTMFNRWRTNFN